MGGVRRGEAPSSQSQGKGNTLEEQTQKTIGGQMQTCENLWILLPVARLGPGQTSYLLATMVSAKRFIYDMWY